MENKTLYTYDLQLKNQMVYAANKKRKIQILGLIYFVLGVALLLFAIHAGSYNHQIIWLSGVVLSYSGFALAVLLNNRRSKIGQRIEKEMRENPDKVLEYKFYEDHIDVTQTSKYINSKTSINYNYISTVTKVDDNSLYFQTKNNFTYFLYEEKGISELFSHLLYKTNK